MSKNRPGGARRVCVYGTLATLFFASLAAPPAQAQSPTVYRVEEDWKLVLRDPDPQIHSPQIALLISPAAGQEDCYFQLQLNHAADAGFSGGGFRVSAIRNDAALDFARSDIRTALRTDGDRIVWTSVMALIDGELLYAIKNGHAADWGAFGGPEYLVRMPANGAVDLSQYDPRQSVQLADIGFGANRVESLTLTKVRLYSSDGTVQEIVPQAAP